MFKIPGCKLGTIFLGIMMVSDFGAGLDVSGDVVGSFVRSFVGNFVGDCE